MCIRDRFWGERWNIEIEYPDDDPVETQHGIDDFLAKEGSNSLEGVLRTANTGLPAGVTLSAPPPQHAETADPAATAATTIPAATAHPVAAVPIKQEGLAAQCGVKYDEVHGSALKNITKLVGQWPGSQQKTRVVSPKSSESPHGQRWRASSIN